MENNNRYTIKQTFWQKWGRQISVLIALAVLMAFFGIASPHFFKQRNLISCVLSAAVNIIVALGMTIVIITGGIDLSVGPILSVCGVLTAKMLVNGCNAALVVICALLVGALLSLINGVLISRFDLQPFLVTLGTQSIFRGASLLYTTGRPIINVPQSFTKVVGGTLGVIPVPVIIMAVFSAFIWWLLKYTRLGVYIFAIGGNANAANLSGIHVRFYRTLAYVLCGICCALASVVLVGRMGAMEPTAGDGYELNAIAAAAIGGASLAGGKGSVIGTLLGALILSVLTNGLTLLNVQSYYQQICTGAVIIFAVMLDYFSNSNDRK